MGRKEAVVEGEYRSNGKRMMVKREKKEKREEEREKG